MAMEKGRLDLPVDSRLRGLRFVGFMEAVRQAVGMPVDSFDMSYIERGSKIEYEVHDTGVIIYESMR